MIDLYTKVGKRVLAIGSQDFMNFPAGEAHIKYAEGTYSGKEIAVVKGTSYEDYAKLMLWSETVRADGGEPHAVIPYLPGARSDRGVPIGFHPYLALIASAQLSSITYFDPHSDVMPKAMSELVESMQSQAKALEVETAHTVLNEVMVDIPPLVDYFKQNQYDGVIAPDKGAVNRAFHMAGALNVPVITAEKTRNFDTGELNGFDCPELPVPDGNYLVVDDICENGGTFIGLAKAIEQKNESVKPMDLYVSHGSFGGSPSIRHLEEYYANIYTTDSFSGVNYAPATKIPVIPYLLGLV